MQSSRHPGLARAAVLGLLFAALTMAGANAQANIPADDSDGDGLNDAVEQSILQQFQPQFVIAKSDCAEAPIAFTADSARPTAVRGSSGTIYGQAFPVNAETNLIEVHYYHLWERDCGRNGHPLDVEHVSVLVQRDLNETGAEPPWKALYWYSAAHEATVCDASRVYVASALKAEAAGPKVWVSSGKHASYLELAECTRGCGADRCTDGPAVATASLINVGEPGRPMNGAIWTSANNWPFTAKMQSDFARFSLELASMGQGSSVAVGDRPVVGVQRTLAIATKPADALSDSARRTGSAVDTANDHTQGALENSAKHVGRSLKRAFTGTIRFLQSR